MLLACSSFCRPILIVLLLNVLCQVFIPSKFVLTEMAFIQGSALVHLSHVPQQGSIVLALEVKGTIGVFAFVSEIRMLILHVCDQALVGFEIQIAFFTCM